MQREPVESTMIVSVGYDDATQTLEVEFHDGNVYIYEGVPEEEYKGLMSADSKGQYMHAHIIDVYPYSQIR